MNVKEDEIDGLKEEINFKILIFVDYFMCSDREAHTTNPLIS